MASRPWARPWARPGASLAALLVCSLVALASVASREQDDVVSTPATASARLECRDRPRGEELRQLPFVPHICCPDVETGRYGTVSWPETPSNRFAKVECPFGPRKDLPPLGVARALRRCKGYQSMGAQWLGSDYSQCKPRAGHDEEHAAEDAAEAEAITSDPESMDSETFQKAAELVESSQLVALTNRTVARSMLQAVSNMVAARPSVQSEGDADGSRRRGLYRVLEAHGRDVRMLPDEREYDQPLANVHLRVARIAAGAEFDGGELLFRANYGGADDGKAAVRLPVEALRQIRLANPSLASAELRVRFMAVRSAQLLDPPGLASAQQQVLSAAFSEVRPEGPAPLEQAAESLDDSDSDLAVVDLNTPVAIHLPFSTWGASHVCAYFDMQDNTWKQGGLSFRLHDDEGGWGPRSGAACEARHLTPFTLLLDPDPRRSLGDLEQPLNVLGYLGSTLSVVGLGATVLTYQFFTRFGQDRWGRVLVQLCLSLLLLHLAYLASNLKGAVPPEACVAVAVLLHLFLLSAFCWMLVEALLMHQLLVTVFQNADTKFVLKRLLFAWGVPVLIVVACGTADPKYYLDTHPDFCVASALNALQHGLATLAPCCAVLAVNGLIFVRVALVLLRRRQPAGLRAHSADTPAVTWAQVRGVVGVAFLLGVTWLLSPLAMSSPVLLVASSALNASQGLAIFVSRVLTHPEARRAWRHRVSHLLPKTMLTDLRFSSASYPVSDKFSMDTSRSSALLHGLSKEIPYSVESRRNSLETVRAIRPAAVVHTPALSSSEQAMRPQQNQLGFASAAVLQVDQWLPQPQLSRTQSQLHLAAHHGGSASKPPCEAAAAHQRAHQKQTICKRRSQLFQQLYVE